MINTKSIVVKQCPICGEICSPDDFREIITDERFIDENSRFDTLSNEK